jgi:hypothetical protein
MRRINLEIRKVAVNFCSFLEELGRGIRSLFVAQRTAVARLFLADMPDFDDLVAFRNEAAEAVGLAEIDGLDELCGAFDVGDKITTDTN